MRLPSTTIRLLPLLAALALPAARAADVQHGKQLLDAHCFHCHDASMYTRPNRRVKNLEQLKKQIRNDALSLGLKWTPAQVADVAAYLNQTYYKLNK